MKLVFTGIIELVEDFVSQFKLFERMQDSELDAGAVKPSGGEIRLVKWPDVLGVFPTAQGGASENPLYCDVRAGLPATTDAQP